MDTKNLTATFVDNGLFTDFALTIAPSFRHLFYWSPWIGAFPKSNHVLPGTGFDGMERAQWLFEAIEKSDLIIFPDVYYGDLQQYLVMQGKTVWGSRMGESLELDRIEAKQIMRQHKVMPSSGQAVEGMDELREYLQKNQKVWVKVSTMRGDFETFKSENYELSEPKLNELEHKLGAKSKVEQFIVEQDISPAVEWGIDAYTIDGKWPERTYCGYEKKDLGFIGRVMEWKEIPQYLRQPNENLSPWFREQEYRGFFSTELRITKERKTFLIDPCCRLPSPPNEIQQVVFDNWGEIISSGAMGQMVSPHTKHKYGVCAMIHSSWADKEWQAVSFPEAIRPYVKLRNHCRIDGVDYAVPQEVGLPEIGAVVGVGNTLKEAIDHANENAEQVKGYYLDVKVSALDDIVEEVEKGRKLGIEL